MANCDEIITGDSGSITLATSAITLYDGASLGCISVAASPSLNQVIAAIAAKVCTLSAPAPPSSTVIMDATLTSCGIVAASGANLNTVLTNIIAQVCQNKTDIAAISCTTISATGCSCANFADAYWSSVTPSVVAAPSTLAEVLCNITKGIEFNNTTMAGNETSAKRWRDNGLKNFLYSDTVTYGNLTTNPGALTFNVAESVFGYNGEQKTVAAQTGFAGLVATKDNYIDYNGTTYVIVSVNVGAAAPAKGSVEHVRLGYITTDGTGGISVTQLKEVQSVAVENIKDSAVTTAKINDLAVTTPKLSTTGVSASTVNIANVTVGVDGRITALTSSFNISAPSNGQILTYNNATSKWVNTSTQLMPSGSADDDMMLWDNAGSTWATTPMQVAKCTDVNVTGITNTQVLSWDTATSKFIAADNTEPVVKYVTTLTELTAALTEFNTAPAKGGIIKLGNSLPVTGNLTGDLAINLGDGIEIWGGGNTIKCGAQKVVISGNRGAFRNVSFKKTADFSNGSPAYKNLKSQQVIEINSATLSNIKIIECGFQDVVGGNDPTNGGTVTLTDADYPVVITNTNDWFTLQMLNCSIGTKHSGNPDKPYGSFDLKWNAGSKDGMRMEFRDWYNNSPEQDSEKTRFQTNFDSLKITVDGSTAATYQNQIVTDQSIQLDIDNSSLAIDPFPIIRDPLLKTVTGTTHTLTIGDAEKFIMCTNGSAVAVTIPPESTTNFVLGTEITISKHGSGNVTATRGAGVALWDSGSDQNHTVTTVKGLVKIKKIGSNTWQTISAL